MTAIVEGARYGRLTVLCLHHKDKEYKKYFSCRCDCGTIKIVRSDMLISKKTKSCGCFMKEKAHERSCKHGCAIKKNQSRLYNIWQCMKQRCYGRKHNSYLYKNINVCEEWKKSFIAFKEWAENNGYKDNLSIDRIDGTKDYCPENCRWADRYTQQHNLKNNFIVTFDGVNMCLSELARKINWNNGTLRYFLKTHNIKSNSNIELNRLLKRK